VDDWWTFLHVKDNFAGKQSTKESTKVNTPGYPLPFRPILGAIVIEFVSELAVNSTGP
jgi:hypothetical protein